MLEVVNRRRSRRHEAVDLSASEKQANDAGSGAAVGRQMHDRNDVWTKRPHQGLPDSVAFLKKCRREDYTERMRQQNAGDFFYDRWGDDGEQHFCGIHRPTPRFVF